MWTDSSVACAIVCENYAIYSIFPSGMMSHSKIARFNSRCTAPFMNIPYLVLQYSQVHILEMDRFMHGGAHGCLINRKIYCHFYQNVQWSRILFFFFNQLGILRSEHEKRSWSLYPLVFSHILIVFHPFGMCDFRHSFQTISKTLYTLLDKNKIFIYLLRPTYLLKLT